MNGKRVEFHPDITYTSEDFRQMKKYDRDRLWVMRKERKEKQQLKKNIEELRSQVSSIAQKTTQVNDEISQSQGVPTHVSLSSASVSNSTSSTTS